MRYAVIFLLLGAGFATIGIRHGGQRWALLWPAASTLLVGAGYAGLGSRVFGKRRNGRYPIWAWVLHAPFLLMTLGIWYLQRWLIRENASDEVAPGIWVGRRPLCREIPPGVKWVVDLTAEFWIARRVCAGREYVCYPTLDAHVTSDAAFLEAVREIAALEGGLYIHCAQGHGRSAAVTAALMIIRGLAADVDEAERIMIAARPKVWLNKPQRDLVRRVTLQLSDASAPLPSRQIKKIPG